MNAIIDFFTSIIDILVSLIQMVVTTVKSILWLIGNLPQIISGVTVGFAFSPSFILPFLGASLALLLVMFVIRLI